MTKKEIAIEQINLQNQIKNLADINIILCCKCSNVLLCKRDSEKVTCLCGADVNVQDCEDYWYDGLENNSEFSTPATVKSVYKIVETKLVEQLCTYEVEATSEDEAINAIVMGNVIPIIVKDSDSKFESQFDVQTQQTV